MEAHEVGRKEQEYLEGGTGEQRRACERTAGTCYHFCSKYLPLVFRWVLTDQLADLPN